jgi:hypothetical protein
MHIRTPGPAGIRAEGDPALHQGSKARIYEGGDGRSLVKDDKKAKHEEQKHHRQHPLELPLPEEL